MHQKRIVPAGKNLSDADKALVLLHGRGANAEDILSIADELELNDFALIAPQATNFTWYPFSFLAPPQQNEPWLSSALSVIEEIVQDIEVQGVKREHIYFLGFSQGACLALEYAARNATKWGGVVAFTGGLIGDKIYQNNYKGDFERTPVFIGTSDPDPHVPVERVNASGDIMSVLNADLTIKIYKNMGHTINQDEIQMAKDLIFHSGILR